MPANGRTFVTSSSIGTHQCILGMQCPLTIYRAVRVGVGIARSLLVSNVTFRGVRISVVPDGHDVAKDVHRFLVFVVLHVGGPIIRPFS